MLFGFFRFFVKKVKKKINYYFFFIFAKGIGKLAPLNKNKILKKHPPKQT